METLKTFLIIVGTITVCTTMIITAILYLPPIILELIIIIILGLELWVISKELSTYLK